MSRMNYLDETPKTPEEKPISSPDIETKDPFHKLRTPIPVVACVMDRSGKLRVRPRTVGYDHTLNVQFPKALRQWGRVFTVERLDLVMRPNSGDFYRAVGKITEIES